MRIPAGLIFGFVVLFLLGWGHSGPRVKVGFYGDDFAGKNAFLGKFKEALDGENAELILARPGESPKALLVKGVQALVIHGNGMEKDLVAEAHSKGVPVLSIERPLGEEGQDFLVAYDPEKEARILAQFALDRVVPGTLIFFGRSNDDWFSKTYRDAIRKALKPSLDKGEVRFGSGSLDHAPLDIWLVGDPKTLSDTWGEVRRMKWGASKKLVVGVGQDLKTCQDLAQGVQEMIVYRSPLKMAEETAYLAVKAARKAKTFDCQFVQVPNGVGSIKTVLLTPKRIEAKDIEATVIKDGVWTREEIFGKK
jgi:D-xylose transport system substrate-binding protein